jgi:hypothetical protein
LAAMTQLAVLNETLPSSIQAYPLCCVLVSSQLLWLFAPFS